MIDRRLFLAALLPFVGCQHGGRLIWPEGHMRGGEGSDPPGNESGEPPDKGEPPGGENGEGGEGGYGEGKD